MRSLVTLFSFCFLGAVGAIIGSMLPDLSCRAGIPIADAGIIRTTKQFFQSVSIFLGSRLAGMFSDKIIVVFGFLLMALTFFFMFFPGNFSFVLCLIALWGIGHGFAHIGIVSSSKNSSNFPKIITALNIVYVCGAVVTPLIVEYFRSNNLNIIFLIAGLCCAVIGLLFFICYRKSAAECVTVYDNDIKDRKKISSNIYLLVVMIFIANGANCGIADWVYSHAILAVNVPSYTASLITSLYWLMQIVSRIALLVLVTKIGDVLVLFICALVAIFGSYCLLHKGLMYLTIGTAFVSLGYAPMYPVLLKIGKEMGQGREGKTLGYLSSSAALGAIIIPFLQGKFWNPENGWMAVTFGCSSVLFLVLMCGRSKKHEIC